MKTSKYLLIGLIAPILVTGLHTPVQSKSSQPSDKQISRGLTRLKKQDYEGAVSIFTKVLAAEPTNYQAYIHRAEARIGLSDNDGAISDFEQAIKLNPNIVESYIKRGKLLAKLGKRNEAIKSYDEALRLNPKDGEARSLRAAALKNDGDFKSAIEDYDAIVKSDSRSMEAWKERAECKLRHNDYKGAIQDYEYLLNKFRTRAFTVHFQMGEAYKHLGETEKAKEHFRQVVDYYSKLLESNRASRSKESEKKGWQFIYRGLALKELGEKEKALSDLENGVQCLPNDSRARYELGRIQIDMGNAEQALKELDRSLELDQRMRPALIERARIYAAKEEYKQALENLGQALKISKSANALLERAMVRVALGDVHGALKDVAAAKTSSPTAIESKQKDISKELAASGGDKSAQAAAKETRLLQQLALLDLADGNLDSAESLARKAIKIKDSATALILMGNIFMKKNAYVEAEALFRTALSNLSTSPMELKKYAVFGLEDLAKAHIAAANYEDAGSILADTRMVRAASGLTEAALSGDMSRKAEQAVEAYKQKKKYDRQEDLVRRVASMRSTSSGDNASGTSAGSLDDNNRKVTINKPIRDKWAIIVGISKFKDSKINLRYAAKDAKDFYEFLVKEKEFAPDHVQLLTDENATRANILSLLGSKWLPRVAEPDDLVVIYFSSHGSPSSLDVGGVNYLVAHDTDPQDLYATGIAMQDLARIIKGRVHCDRIMLVLDACHSGVASPSHGKGMLRAANVDVERVVQGTGQLVISSSTPEQRSWESDRYEGSVFTKYLIEGLRRNGKSTTLGDAFNYLQEEVRREVLRDKGLLQTPIMKSKWEGKELILGVKPSAPTKGIGTIGLPDSIDNDHADNRASIGKATPDAKATVKHNSKSSTSASSTSHRGKRKKR